LKRLTTLRDIKMKQVVRNTLGEELVIDLSQDKENTSQTNREPAYLDDYDDEDDGTNMGKMNSCFYDDEILHEKCFYIAKKQKTVSTPLREGRNSKGRKKEGGWFSSLGGMISKAFW
jgi:hypothetical protein